MAATPVVLKDHEANNFLMRILMALLAPLGYDKSIQRHRATAIVESGTVTTCGTVTNAAQLGGVQAQIPAYAENLAAWNACVRSRIT